ncbi:putative transcriptional regulatory protein NarL [compost metagenome]
MRRWTQTLQMRVCDLGIVADFPSSLLRGFAVIAGSSAVDNVATLTERERQIISEVAQGRPISAIASSLGLSGHTVKVHLRNIYRKLGAHGQAQATAIARSRGLLGSPNAVDPLRQQPGRLAAHHRLGSPGHSQLAVDVLDVRLDRIGRDVQALADFPV